MWNRFNDIFSKEEMIELQNILRQKKLTISTAESCTGGLISHLITTIPGSSDIYLGSIIAYSNYIKQKKLNVSSYNLNNFGAVSCEVVSDMLDGLDFGDIKIAISGIAGPTGATENKPVGMVVIGVEFLSKDIEIYYFKGSREDIQIQSAKKSLKKILNLLKNS